MDFTSLSRDSESDPSFVMLDESDDEETIAQEESLEPEIDPQEELRILANDLNVSLEELAAQSASHRSRRTHKKVDYQAMLREEQMKKKIQGVVLGQPKSLSEMCSKLLQNMKVDQAGPSTDTSVVSTSISELTKFYLINTLSNHEEEEKDADYKPMLKPTFAREIRTGPSYQAEVPEESAVSSSADADAQCSDKLLWKPPPVLSEEEIDAYLCRVNSIVQQINSTEVTCNRAQHRDNEQALEILLQCNFNEELALDIFKQKLQQYLNGLTIQNKTYNSREYFENETNSSTENIENEASNEFPSPPKVNRQCNQEYKRYEKKSRRNSTSVEMPTCPFGRHSLL